MSEFKMLHVENDRTTDQHVYVQTGDGAFRYEVFLDYAKGLPEDLFMMPVNGNVGGGFCDKDDNLYLVFRGGGVGMTPGAPPSYIKLDPDGNYLGRLCEGKLGGMPHFGQMTPEGTILMAFIGRQQVVEMDLQGNELMTIGELGRPNGNKPFNPDLDPHYVRIHYGLFATEPIHYGGHGVYDQMMDFENTEFIPKPFCNPNAVAQDSRGNLWVTDGYGNFGLYKFDRKGNLLDVYGGKGVWDYKTDTPGKFLVAHSVDVDANDHVWVCDREKDAIHVFDTEGNVVFYASHNLGQPSGVGSDGKYVYVVGRGGYITIFDLAFNLVGKLGFFNGNLRAHDIAVDSKGNLYLFPTHANEEHQVIALKRIR